jgi:hypothetical protein
MTDNHDNDIVAMAIYNGGYQAIHAASAGIARIPKKMTGIPSYEKEGFYIVLADGDVDPRVNNNTVGGYLAWNNAGDTWEWRIGSGQINNLNVECSIKLSSNSFTDIRIYNHLKKWYCKVNGGVHEITRATLEPTAVTKAAIIPYFPIGSGAALPSEGVIGFHNVMFKNSQGEIKDNIDWNLHDDQAAGGDGWSFHKSPSHDQLQLTWIGGV